MHRILKKRQALTCFGMPGPMENICRPEKGSSWQIHSYHTYIYESRPGVLFRVVTGVVLDLARSVRSVSSVSPGNIRSMLDGAAFHTGFAYLPFGPTQKHLPGTDCKRVLSIASPIIESN
ncbi:hypothetical protein M5D96_003735, partial [Drosophila gunungcola]